MLPAFLTTIFFSLSVICAHRSVKMIGAAEANFWRLSLATLFLAGWAHPFGQGLGGVSFPVFLMSGLIGVGIGDTALFQALPRLGTRLTLLLLQCLSVPFGAAIEWFWMGTLLTIQQVVWIAVILGGVSIALLPRGDTPRGSGQIVSGVAFAVLAALGNAFGAVLSRRAFFIAHDTGLEIDGGTAAYQRLVGGVIVAGIFLLVAKWPILRKQLATGKRIGDSKTKWKRAWPWVLANSVLGQTIGVSLYQWALETTPTGIVLAIIAITPLVALPFTRLMEGERPGMRSLLGGVIAVAGAVALALTRQPG
jgi:drug/metabolite transporter (DMT)-like permease